MNIMKINRIRLLILAALLAWPGNIFQIQAQQEPDSIIMQAMQDELLRNIDSLYVEDMARPFFIAYSIADVRLSYASATLGALKSSGERNYKDWHVRLMVGDYDLNDENFVAPQAQEMTYENGVDMPVDADYYGIRRSLWLTTNRVYNAAAKTYRNKIRLIDQKKLDTTDIDLPDFSRAPAVEYDESPVKTSWSLRMLESVVRDLSALFSGRADIYSSDVRVRVFESMVHFINSEGTQLRYPFVITTLSVAASTMTPDSENLSESITWVRHTPEELPGMDTLAADVRQLIAYIEELRNAPRFEDEYTGPVLLLDDEASKTFSNVLFGGSDNLIASRGDLHSSSQMDMYYARSSNDFESRIGKLVVSKDLTVTAEPAMHSWQGTSLLGHYEVDAEGVVPPDSMLLIENGILHTMLNGRTPTRSVPLSNGHMRHEYSVSGLSQSVGPGVIYIRATGGLAMDSLHKKLKHTAGEYGHDYAYLIRPLGVSSNHKPRAVYRIHLESGTQELIRSVTVSSADLRALKKPLGISDKTLVWNTLWSGYSGNSASGMPVSFITPSGLLLDDIKLSSRRKALTSRLPIVDNPSGLNDPSEEDVSGPAESSLPEKNPGNGQID